MSSAWLLPENVADVLPAQARQIEALRRGLLDGARSYGFELVLPPLMEHIESLLSGPAQALDLKTFKLVDQFSGRTLGIRADSTPQAARIDAHLLNRQGVVRLCYCGPVLHALPSGPRSTREPLQFGAEIYGHGGLEADLEIIDLALDSLRVAGAGPVTLDLGDARIVKGVLMQAGLAAAGQWERRAAVQRALHTKDAAVLAEESQGLSAESAQALNALVGLFGDIDVLRRARACLPADPSITAALADLRWLARRIEQSHPETQVSFDLADLGDDGYYSGVRFAAYCPGAGEAVVRGGRYDEVGAVFGRNRPAVGFGLDVKTLAGLAPITALHAAVRAPWAEDSSLRDAIRALREQGETVVCVLPGHEQEASEFACDRALVPEHGNWIVRKL